MKQIQKTMKSLLQSIASVMLLIQAGCAGSGSSFDPVGTASNFSSTTIATVKNVFGGIGAIAALFTAWQILKVVRGGRDPNWTAIIVGGIFTIACFSGLLWSFFQNGVVTGN
jgi:O-antigen ligase